MNTWAEAMKAIGALEDRVREMDEKGRNLMQRWHDLGVAVSKLTGEVDALREDRVKKLEGYCFGTQQATSDPSNRPGDVVSMPGEFKFFPLPPRRTRYLDANGAIVDRTAPSPTHDGRVVVSANEYARLGRLDAAVREFFGWLRPGETTWLDRESSVLKPIREALER